MAGSGLVCMAPATAEPAAPTPNGNDQGAHVAMTVHEWGTFTVLQGSDGKSPILSKKPHESPRRDRGNAVAPVKLPLFEPAFESLLQCPDWQDAQIGLTGVYEDRPFDDPPGDNCSFAGVAAISWPQW